MSILQMNVSAGVLIIAIVMIRSLALNKLPKSFFLALWMIATCRLLMPFKISSSFSIFNAFNRVMAIWQPKTETSSIQPKINLNVIGEMPQIILALENGLSITPQEIIWVVGVTTLAIIFCFSFYKNYTELKTALPIKGNVMLDQWQSEQTLYRPLQILVSDKIIIPIAFGIIKPKIILPKSIHWEDEQLMNYVLSHELQHIKHFDMLWKIILMVILCLHWFNPLVWVMYLLANRDLELACDEKIIKQMGENIKASYALSLIGMAEQRSKFTPLYNSFGKNAAEERIVSIMKFKKSSIFGVALAFTLVLGTATIFATSSNDKAKEAENQTESISTYEEGVKVNVTSDDDSIKRENLMRVKVNDLETALLTFEGIDEANVSLVIYETSSSFYITTNNNSSATITLTTNKTISEDEVAAIATFVSKSFNDLQIEDIQIIDQNKNILFPELK